MANANKPESGEDGTGNRKRMLAAAALIALVLPVAIVVMARLASRRAEATIKKQIDAIRAAGEPVTAEDLARLYPDPPPEHDALRLLQPSMDKVQIPMVVSNLPVIGDVFPLRGMPFTEATKADLNTFLGQNAKALAAFPEAGLDGAWFGNGFPASLTNGSAFRVSQALNLGKVLCLQALSEAEAGRGSKAAQALTRSLDVARALHSGIFIHHLARRVAEDRICTTLEEVVNRVQLSDADLLAIQSSFTNNSPGGLHQAYINLRCFHIRMMDACRKSPELAILPASRTVTWQERIISWGMRISGKVYRDSDYLLLLDLNRERIKAMTLPPRERFARLVQLIPTRSDQMRRSVAFRNVDGPGNTYHERAVWDEQIVTRMRVASVALAVERWRLAHEGRLPDSLAQLVPGFLPAIPTDPFDGQPLRYRKLVRGYVVYSVGPNFTDDGGLEKPANATESTPYDITFTVGR
jgi:hypothetical protein